MINEQSMFLNQVKVLSAEDDKEKSELLRQEARSKIDNALERFSKTI